MEEGNITNRQPNFLCRNYLAEVFSHKRKLDELIIVQSTNM